MNEPLTAAEVRAALARNGLDVPDERAERMVPAVEAARESGSALAAIDMGYRGPPAFRPPGPADV